MRMNIMDRDYFVKLTLAVYKVTELFPQDTSLKCDIRNLANEILANLLTNGRPMSDIEKLEGYFDEAEAQNWVDSRNFLVLRREYDKIKEEFQAKSNFNNGRQKKIIEIAQGNGRVKLGELLKFFPEVNKRTLMRDLESLSRAGIVSRNGNGRARYYQFKR